MASLSLGTLLGVALVGGGFWLRSEHEASIRRERDRARGDRDLVGRADAIHLGRADPRRGAVQPRGRASLQQRAGGPGYESAFREAGFGAIGDDPAPVAARVVASAARVPLVAALGTGRSAPPTSDAGRGSWAWRRKRTLTPGAAAPAIRRRGRTAPPWPNWPRPRRWQGSPRHSWSRWGSGYTTSAGTGPASWRGCTRSIRTISGPPSHLPGRCRRARPRSRGPPLPAGTETPRRLGRCLQQPWPRRVRQTAIGTRPTTTTKGPRNRPQLCPGPQ